MDLHLTQLGRHCLSRVIVVIDIVFLHYLQVLLPNIIFERQIRL